MRIEKIRNLLDLGDHEKDAAATAWEVIERDIHRLVPEFYDHLREKGEFGFFKDTDIKLLQKKQVDYWRRLFKFGFNDAYFDYVRKIWKIHHQFGVSLDRYIAAYAWYSERFFELIARSDPRPPLTRHDLLIVTNRVMYVDMMIASASGDTWEID